MADDRDRVLEQRVVVDEGERDQPAAERQPIVAAGLGPDVEPAHEALAIGRAHSRTPMAAARASIAASSAVMAGRLSM